MERGVWIVKDEGEGGEREGVRGNEARERGKERVGRCFSECYRIICVFVVLV